VNSSEVEFAERPALDPELAAGVGAALARMDPWLTLGSSAESLAEGLCKSSPDLVRVLALESDTILGIAGVRCPWLRGAYIEFLAVLPQAQGRGIGAALLERVEGTYRGRVGNLWLCVSGFNDPAQRFYARHGFVPVGTIPDLLKAGEDEILMRKVLAVRG
jgi:ribosomal protein S18 acetylase RimI-like enzyme